jgi:hypothetical protein
MLSCIWAAYDHRKMRFGRLSWPSEGSGEAMGHNKGKPNYLHSVEVNGVPYRSTWAAWETLQICGALPESTRISRCQDFRGLLKASKSGRLDYTDPTTGKTYRFRLIPYNAKL